MECNFGLSSVVDWVDRKVLEVGTVDTLLGKHCSVHNCQEQEDADKSLSGDKTSIALEPNELDKDIQWDEVGVEEVVVSLENGFD